MLTQPQRLVGVFWELWSKRVMAEKIWKKKRIRIGVSVARSLKKKKLPTRQHLPTRFWNFILVNRYDNWTPELWSTRDTFFEAPLRRCTSPRALFRYVGPILPTKRHPIRNTVKWYFQVTLLIPINAPGNYNYVCSLHDQRLVVDFLSIVSVPLLNCLYDTIVLL